MKKLEGQIHDMSEKIYELQAKTEKLTNGQRYAAINEIEKSIAPLRNDLNHLERKLYSQQYDEQEISHQIDRILNQISELETLKSDLNARINTETEHARQEFHETTIKILKEEIRPLRTSLEENQKEISNLKTDVGDLRLEILTNEKNREINDAQKFDRFKWILTAIIAVLSALSMLALWLEPSIQMIFHVFFG
jgi:archaellum component FlaC